jgi:hypothetical protein
MAKGDNMFVEIDKNLWIRVDLIQILQKDGNSWVAIIEGRDADQFVTEEVAQKILLLTGSK